MDDYSSVPSTVDMALRHPLFIALVQLCAGLAAAYFLTESWQRWRQRREFQYRTMSKFSETSMAVFVSVTSLLVNKSNSMPRSADDERRYIEQRVPFHSLEAEIMASFTRAEILQAYYELEKRLKTLFDLALSSKAIKEADFQPTQQSFLNERKAMLGQMIAEMKLMSWRERSYLHSHDKPLKMTLKSG